MDRKTWVAIGLAAALGIPGLVFGLGFWAAGGWPEPDVLDVPVEKGVEPRLKPKEIPAKLRILSYNIHFGVGRKEDLKARRSRLELERIQKGLAELISRLEPDIVLLQEVDFDSDRTANINQMHELAAATGFPYMAPVVTWKKNWLPYPGLDPRQHYGKMLSGQAVLSRFPITANRRLRLPQPQANSLIYNAFYLNRALQEVDIDVAGRPLKVFNTHTEAFDVSNRQQHAEQIRDWVRRERGEWTILAGDFNAVPPEASFKKGFPDEPKTDMSEDRSVATLRELDFGEIFPPERYLKVEELAYTFPSDFPNRRLDYIHFSQNFRMVEGFVVHEAETLSDHLPVFVELEW